MSSRLHAALAIATAVGLHIGAFAFRPAPAGAVSAGAGGEDLISLQAADASLAEMVENWDKPPEVEAEPEVQTFEPQAFEPPPPDITPDIAPPVPTPVPSVAPPMVLPQMAEVLPQADTSLPPPPPPEPEPKPEPKPEKPAPKVEKKPEKKKPKKAKKPAAKAKKPASAGQAAQKAAGSGGGAQAGDSGTAASATLSKARKNDLRAGWGATIRSRVERRKAYPSAAGRASGTVTVRISVSRAGQLVGVSVAKSSGNAALDQAALKAVKSAGKFPAAPKGLTDASYTFNLPMKFSR